VKIILISSGVFSIPTMHHLAGQGMLHTVVSIGKTNKNNALVELNANYLKIPFKRFLKNELTTSLKDLLTEAAPFVVFVFGCPYKLPSELFSIPKYGFFNIHFSLLPAYRGPSPMFWQIKNGETTSGITIHQMTDDLDGGAMLAQQESAVSPAESCGLFSARLSMETVDVVIKAIKKLVNTGTDLLLPQNEIRASYFKRPVITDLQIDWDNQTAVEIESLVNATNPDYGGATTSFRNQPFRILETNRVQLNAPPVPPGTIVHADINYGIVVACKDSEYLRINIAQLSEGIFSTFKLAGLGIKAGERFEDSSKLVGITVEP